MLQKQELRILKKVHFYTLVCFYGGLVAVLLFVTLQPHVLFHCAGYRSASIKGFRGLDGTTHDLWLLDNKQQTLVFRKAGPFWIPMSFLCDEALASPISVDYCDRRWTIDHLSGEADYPDHDPRKILVPSRWGSFYSSYTLKMVVYKDTIVVYFAGRLADYFDSEFDFDHDNPNWKMPDDLFPFE